jgi:hypothetical protein
VTDVFDTLIGCFERPELRPIAPLSSEEIKISRCSGSIGTKHDSS